MPTWFSYTITLLSVMLMIENCNALKQKGTQALSIREIGDIVKWMAKPESKPWKVSERDFQWYRKEGFKTTYMNDIDLKNMNCFAINFGWSVQIDIPQITWKSAMSKSISIPLKSSAPSLCTIVLIGKRNREAFL